MVTRAERLQAFLFLMIGIFVTGSVILTLVGLPFGKKKRIYLLRFTESVVGLDVDAVVRYKGVKYGKIKSISVDPAEPEAVNVTLELEPEAPIKVSTIGRISSVFPGPHYIELFDSRAGSPDLQEGSVIPVATSTLTRLLSTGENLSKVVANLESWTTPEQRDHFFGALTQLEMTLESVRTQVDTAGPALIRLAEAWTTLGENLNGLVVENREPLNLAAKALAESLDRLRGFMASGQLDVIAEKLARALDRIPNEFERDGQALRAWLDAHQLAPQLERVTASIENTGTEFRKLAGILGTEVKALAHHDLAPALRDLRSAAEALSRLLATLERNPRMLLFGEPPREVPLPGERKDGG